jgi:GDPmannose 4,6-dehydratase
MSRVLITGISGQDGSYLAEFLLEKKGYEVHGVAREIANIPSNLVKRLSRVSSVDLTNPKSLEMVLIETRPDEIYHLAAHHHSSQLEGKQFSELDSFFSVNLMAANVILEFMKNYSPLSRFFYAASSHIFGTPRVSPQTESTPFLPDTPYGISKTAGINLCRYFREKHQLFASVGILYNHESARRSSKFITTMIARCAARAVTDKPEILNIRDLDAVVDWGASQDYVEAMWLTLQNSTSDDFIIASGTSHTVREFSELAFKCVNLNASDFLTQDPKKIEHRRLPYVGNSNKIRRKCQWEPKISFSALVKQMVEHQLYILKIAGR